MESLIDYTILQQNLVRAINQQPEPGENFLQLNWTHKNPQGRANQIAHLLGEPNSLDRNPGGQAIWRYVDPFFRKANIYNNSNIKPTDVYSKLVIKDEEIPHLVPGPHTDWFYAYMYIDVPSDRLNDVLALTESLGYDSMSKEIYARCHFMPANITSLFIAKQLALGYKNLAHAQQEYVALIPILAKEESQNMGVYAKEKMGPWHLALTQFLFGLR